MSINCTDRELLEDFIKDNLKESRYRHSEGVEEMAVRLARLHGADVEKAAFAGRYHDLAKNFDTDTMDKYIRKYGLPEKLIGNNALAHSKVGAAILEHEFGVTDEDILNAVRYHTTARRDMSLLEEIVYVSDAIEDNRNYPELKYLQKLAETDLDRTCLIIMDYTIEKIEEKGSTPDNTTLDAREWILERLRSK